MANRGRILSHCSCMFVSSTSLIKWSTVVAGCLLLQQHHSVLVDGSRTRRVGETKDESYHSLHFNKRQDSPPTSTDVLLSTVQEESEGQRFLSALSSYWYVLLVILVILVVVFVFLCACIVRKRRHHHHSLRMEMGSHGYSRSPESNHSTRQLSSTDTHSAPQHTNSSGVDLASSPGSMSIDPTPIPSPQPSFASSSQRSHRSSGHKRRRNLSPGHTSSGSEETIKAYETRSVSSLGLGASAHAHPRIPRAESVNSGERRRSHSSRSHRGHRRTTSNPQVKVTPILDNSSFYSSPSVVSIISASSNRSSRSNRSNRSSRSNRSHSDSSSTVVEVDVKVHLTKEQQREARTEIAAALAESARQLAQSAANFGQEEEPLWHSQSLPYHASSPHRVTPSTTHSLPTAAMYSKRQLFPSHSSSALTSSREFYGSRPSFPRAVPTASLDRPRNTASLDRPTYYERPRRDSIGQRSQPESPLTFSISSPSQKSLASNYEYAPGNYPGSQVHLSRSPHYLRNYHSSSAVTEPGLKMPHSQSQVSLDYVHSPPYPASGQFQYQNGHYPPPVVAHEPASAVSLDFSHHNSKLPLNLNGMTSPASYPSNLPSRLEELRYRLDSDLRMDLKTNTESDSNSSTLRASSHSDNKDRLSRLSEKSEQMDSENEAEATTTTQENGGGGLSSLAGRQDDVELGSGVDKRAEQLSMASSAKVPNHIQYSSVHKPSNSRKPKHKQSRTEISLPSLTSELVPTHNTLMNHTEASLDSSHSSQSTQSVNDSSTFTKPTATHTLIRQNSLPNVSPSIQLDASQNSVTQSLHRSSSGPSIEDEEERVSSIASGYAATGSASSLDTNTRESNGRATAATELNQTLESQFSYPLQKLLGDSLSYDVDDDENFSSLDQSLMTVPVGQNHHRNEQYHHRNHRHRDRDYHQQSYHSNERTKVTREMPGTSYMNGTQNHHGYNHPRTGSEQVRYNHSSHHESITIDV